MSTIGVDSVQVPYSSLRQSGHTAMKLARSIANKLSGADNVLIVGVGGGNDAVTSLILPAQFERDFGFKPRRLQVAAMLPDVLEYSGMTPLIGERIGEITPSTTRSVNGKTLRAFPEPLLATHKSRFGVERVVGISMREGSAGVCSALDEFISRETFDLVVACDVGGDFIATPTNLGVLSPMMDAYALDAFRRLNTSVLNTQFLYCVFGLGTDGESTPAQLHDALHLVGNYTDGAFDQKAVSDVHDFYRTVIELNRKSRTADLTFRSIAGEHLEPMVFRARFHTQPRLGDIKTYYGEFMHAFGDEFSGRYYLFEDLGGIRNPFEFHCVNGVEWFLGIQRLGAGLNHELNGQSYACIEDLFNLTGSAQSVFFGTPSSKFTAEQRAHIVQEAAQSVSSGVYDTALVLRADSTLLGSDIKRYPINDTIMLIASTRATIQEELLATLAKLG